jgi:O-antigen/teichoic acid export membrane protein
MNSTTSLGNQTIIGVIWAFIEQLSKVGIQAGTSIILAWFLLPEDFGLIAMITVFFAIGNSLMDSGFSQAIIRKKEINQTDYSTAFYANLCMGIVAYLILFVSAPLISNFYDEPRLTILVRIVGFVVIINSFKMVQMAQLTRDLNFKAQFRITFISSILSAAIAIVMASQGFGVWSLVAQMLIAAFGSTLLFWITNKWKPMIVFSIQSLKEMFGFGSKLLLSDIINTAFQNIYVVVIGKLFLATYVGYYFFAQQIQKIITQQLTNSVQKVTYPALSTIQDDDESLKNFYRKIIQVVTFVLFPSLIALIVLAEPLFSVLLKDKWLPAVPYLQLLCVAGLFYPLHSINLNIIKVKGRSDLFLYLEIIKKIMLSIVLLISVNFGILGILVGQIVSSMLAYIPNSYYSIKLINYSVSEQLKDFIPTLLLSICMGLFMYLTGLLLPFGDIVHLVVLGSVGIIFYIASNYLLKTSASLYLLKILKSKFKYQGFN